jgi:lysozyme
VGVGHVIDPKHIGVKFEDRLSLSIPEGWDRTLTDAEVSDLLCKDLARFEAGVERLCAVGLTPSRFDSLVSFSFNVGLGNLQRSTLRMKHNRGDYEGAAEEFRSWTKAGGRVLPGLVKRREDERRVYLMDEVRG